MAEAAYARGPAERGQVRAQGRGRVRVVRCLWLSLLLSVAVEWIGMTWWWPELGGGHAESVLRQEMEYLHADFRPVARRIEGAAQAGYFWAFEWTGLERALGWLGGVVQVPEYVRAALAMVQVLLVRVVLLAFSVPAFVLFGVVGVTSGLTLRDIRRWSAGREFGGVYHTAKRAAPRALAAAAVAYLAIPVAVHPSAVIVPGAALFGALAMVVAASFKKYL